MSVDLGNLFFIIMAVMGLFILAVALVIYCLATRTGGKDRGRKDEEGLIQFVDNFDDGWMEEVDDIFVIDVEEEIDVTPDFWILNTNWFLPSSLCFFTSYFRVNGVKNVWMY